jgi:hypothetical protein
MARESSPLNERLGLRVDLRFPHFEKHFEVSDPKSRMYAFETVDAHGWYEEFTSRVFGALNEHRFLPIYRMCDGEFLFALKGSPEDKVPWHELPPRRLARRLLRRPAGRSGHRSGSQEYGYESYSADQVQQVDATFVNSVRFVAEKGILALCFHDSPLALPFVTAMCDWFDANQIRLHRGNYYHFYSVYVLLHGPDRTRLLADKRVLVITGLTDEKRMGIETGLRAAGARSVQFLPISRSQSMLDRLDLTNIEKPVDVVLVGAGVGAANVLAQLEPLGTVCVDAGFALSTLADPDLRWNRPYCVPDDEFDSSKVRWGT